MQKSCGGCTHWNKWKHNPKGLHKKLSSDGLCSLHDMRCPSDYVCDNWKGIKYKRGEHK